MKLGAYANLTTLNSMVLFICPALDRKYSFWLNLAQKIKVFKKCQFKVIDIRKKSKTYKKLVLARNNYKTYLKQFIR